MAPAPVRGRQKQILRGCEEWPRRGGRLDFAGAVLPILGRLLGQRPRFGPQRRWRGPRSPSRPPRYDGEALGLLLESEPLYDSPEAMDSLLHAAAAVLDSGVESEAAFAALAHLADHVLLPGHTDVGG